MDDESALRRDWQPGALLRGHPHSLRAWIDHADGYLLAHSLGLIVLGAGLYGAAMGCWRAPRQAFFVGIKFPLIILLTTVGNSLLNGMLAPLLGLRATFRQSFLAILMSFTIAATILGSFSPLILFLVWNTPPMPATSAGSTLTYNLIQLLHVAIIALAGIMANFRLLQLLRELSGSAMVARRVLVAWLLGNLFFGSQVSWILRPFIGSPELPVQFLRATAFRGNFYETVFHSLLRVLNLSS